MNGRQGHIREQIGPGDLLKRFVERKLSNHGLLVILAGKRSKDLRVLQYITESVDTRLSCFSPAQTPLFSQFLNRAHPSVLLNFTITPSWLSDASSLLIGTRVDTIQTPSYSWRPQSKKRKICIEAQFPVRRFLFLGPCRICLFLVMYRFSCLRCTLQPSPSSCPTRQPAVDLAYVKIKTAILRPHDDPDKHTSNTSTRKKTRDFASAPRSCPQFLVGVFLTWRPRLSCVS